MANVSGVCTKQNLMSDIMSLKYMILKECFEDILKRSKKDDSNLVDALVNAVREADDTDTMLDLLKKPSKEETIKYEINCNIYNSN
jgi:hypothetical protein